MATKITELSEQRKQEALQKEIKLNEKLEQKQKNKEEQVTFQKTQTMERLKKWQERRDKQSHSMLVQDKRRLNLANKLTVAQTDAISKMR